MNKGTFTQRIISTIILALAVLAPALVLAADLTVYRVSGIVNGLNPADAAWAKAATAALSLENRYDWPDRHVFPTGTAPRIYNIKAIHDGAFIYFLFQWSDSTQNITTTDVPTYPDGAAIMFPMWNWTDPCTPAQTDNMFMGMFQWDPALFGVVVPPGTVCTPPYNLVTNIHLWKGNYKNKGMNIMAVGEGGTIHKTGNPPENGPAPGTASHPAPAPQPDPTQNLTTSQSWAAGTWTVIIKRTMAPSDPNAQFDFAGRIGVTGIPFALANWNGQLQERANLKFATANWLLMDVQP